MTMPEELQDLSREHGGVVDQMYAAGYSKEMIMQRLKDMRRINAE